MIKILIISLRKNKEREFNSINNKNIDVDATRLPNNNLFIFITFFNTFEVANNNIKSKKKLSKNTKSK